MSLLLEMHEIGRDLSQLVANFRLLNLVANCKCFKINQQIENLGSNKKVP